MAAQYDSLAKNQRFIKIYSAVDHFHTRALHFYSFGKENIFYKKCDEYKMNYRVEDARKMSKPRITEDNENAPTPTAKMKKISVV